MALLPQAANTPENNESLDDVSAIPAGDYLIHMAKNEYKATKSKTGYYLAITWKVISPEQFKGKILFSNLNLDNPSPVAVEIARKELNSICQAANKVGVQDADELLNTPIVGVVVVDSSNPNYPPSNKIRGYKPASEFVNASPASVGGNPPANATVTPGAKKLPWEK